jgi:hypothetical protein
MMAGRNYSRKDNPQTSDLPLIWDSANSDWRLTTLSDIKTLFESTDTQTPVYEPVTQYVIPTDGFSIQVGATAENVDKDTHLILAPAGTLATGTIVLPLNSSARDKQTVQVSSTQAVTSLTIDPNGASIEGSPPNIAQWGYFKLKYDLTTDTWYQIG